MIQRPRPARTTLVVALLLTVPAGCGGSDEKPSAAAAAPASTGTSPSTTSAAAEPEPSFVGTWRAGPALVQVIADEFERKGMTDWQAAFPPGTSPGDEFTFDLKLQNGGLIFEATLNGEPQGVWDRQSYEATDQTIAVSPFPPACTSTLRWSVVGDELTLRPAEDTCGTYDGYANQVYMEAMYGSVAFVRVDS